MRPPVDVSLPAIHVTPRKVTSYDFGIKDYYNPVADWIASHTAAPIRKQVKRVAVAILAKFDPKLTVEATCSGSGPDAEITLVGIHVHGFRGATATVLGVGPRLTVFESVQPGDYRVIETGGADGRTQRTTCRDFWIYFDIELAFNPGIAKRFVPVRLILPVTADAENASARIASRSVS